MERPPGKEDRNMTKNKEAGSIMLGEIRQRRLFTRIDPLLQSRKLGLFFFC